MIKRYRISAMALDDIDAIWLYTYQTWSRVQADRYYDSIIDEIEYTASNFETAKDMSHIKKGYRSSIVKSHIIFYKKTKDEIIEVVRILHQRMDIENRLK